MQSTQHAPHQRSCPVNQPLHLIHVLHRRRQVLKPIFGNQDVILDPHATDIPILVQHLEVDVRGMNRVAEVRLDNKAAEVNLCVIENGLLVCIIWSGKWGGGEGGKKDLHQVQR